MGRPTDYRPEYAEQARNYCLLGATDKDLAGFFDVSEQTINAWKSAHPEFLESLKAGKDMADGQVAERLFRRAMGYSHDAVKIAVNASGDVTEVPFIEHYPPDTTAAIFWLKNRQPGRWRDVKAQEVSAPGGGPVQTESVTKLDMSGLSLEQLRALSSISLGLPS